MDQKPTHNETLSALLEAKRSEAKLFELIADNGGELSPELDHQLARIEVGLPKKVDGYKYFMDMLDASAAQLQTRITQMEKQLAGVTFARNRIEEHLEEAMHIHGLTELKGHDFRFKIVACPRRTVIDDESKVPPKYLITSIKTTVDKAALKKDLESGNPELAAAAHLEGGTTLRCYVNREER